MKRFIKFLMGGLISYGIKLIVTFLLTEVCHLWYLFSYSITMIIIVLYGFFYNFYFVFKNIKDRKNKFIIYTISLLFFSAIDIYFVKILTAGLGIFYLYSIIIVTTILVVLKFLFYKIFVFVDYEKGNIPGNFFNKYESKNFLIKGLIKSFFSALFGLISEAGPKSILDVGCGEGYVIEKIKSKFKDIDIEGSDLEEEVIELAKQRVPAIKFSVESIYDLKREEKSFDLVSVLETLEHLETPDKAIKEVKRVSKKYCIFSVPYEPFWRIANMIRFSYLSHFGNTPGHIQHWTKTGFKKMLKKHFKHVVIKRAKLWNFALCWD